MNTSCNAVLLYPVDNGWITIVCPRYRGHDEMHNDEIYWLCFTDEDIVWYETQYRLCTS